MEEGQAASHARQGWEELTDQLIAAVAAKPEPVVFMLWGAHAQNKKRLIETQSQMMGCEKLHLILQANHPSPLSAMRPPQPFLGCDHFKQANEFQSGHGKKEVIW